MAIQVGGTTVVSNTRGLNNIASVDAATVSILKGAGLGGSSYVFKSANYTANSGEVILVDTSGGAFTVSLPASPSTGDAVTVLGVDPYTSAGVIISGNGNLILADTSYTNESSNTVLNFYFNGTIWSASKGGTEPLFGPQVFLPDWSTPDLTITTSGAITLDPDVPDTVTCWVYLLGGGGCGNNSAVYQSGWGFGGSGGMACLYFTSVGNLRNATCTIGAGKTVSGGWSALTSSHTSITLESTEIVSTSPNGSLYYDYNSVAGLSGGVEQDAYLSINDSGALTNNSGYGIETLIGGSQSGSGVDPGGPNWIFAASEGYGAYAGGGGGAPNGTSVFAGDGNSTNGAAGTYPGGGGAGSTYVNTALGHGADGNIRIYYQP
jgi:hypothetical protein